MNRRNFLKIAAVAVAGFLWPWRKQAVVANDSEVLMGRPLSEGLPEGVLIAVHEPKIWRECTAGGILTFTRCAMIELREGDRFLFEIREGGEDVELSQMYVAKSDAIRLESGHVAINLRPLTGRLPISETPAPRHPDHATPAETPDV
jgi:hypothetical protein